MRLRPYRSPKELFPLLLKHPDDPSRALPAPVCHFSLEALRVAGAERCVVVISDSKGELVRVLGDGEDYGVPIGYVVQRSPRGLTDVIRCASRWLEGDDVLFALPDTVIFPTDALLRLNDERVAAGADLALGVFPTEEPERLAPVEIVDGEVVRIHDKPAVAPVRNTWGVLSWSWKFTDFCRRWDEERGDAPGILSDAMEAARRGGLRVVAAEMEGGVFRDVGTPEGLASTMRLLSERGLVFGS
jgi:glucose-1-phosphate thymidylyltransferase